MTPLVALPFGGVSGWLFLERSREGQQATFNEASVMQRDTDYFRDNIAGAKTAADLVADRRLLTVALGAFGLDDDINNRAFIEKILDDGVLNEDALGNKLADKRYYALAKAFGFGDFSVANTQLSDFPDEIIADFQDRQFEIAVGDQNTAMRLALGVERDLATVLDKDTTEDGLWFSIMGTPTLRRVFEVALGVPESLALADLDLQLVIFRDRAEAMFGEGEVSQFADPEKQDELVRRFLARSDAGTGFSATTQGLAALTLLQSVFVAPLF